MSGSHTHVPQPAETTVLERGGGGRKQASLSRPERAPSQQQQQGYKRPMVGKNAGGGADHTWGRVARLVTACVPTSALRRFGMKDWAVQQAWREKLGLCIIIFCICAFVAFFTLFFQTLMCPPDQRDPQAFVPFDERGYTSIFGRSYDINAQREEVREKLYAIGAGRRDVTGEIFSQSDEPSPFGALERCRDVPPSMGIRAYKGECDRNNDCTDPGTGSFLLRPRDVLKAKTTEYSWDDTYRLPFVFAINGIALNFEKYLQAYPEVRPGDKADAAIREFVNRAGKRGDVPAKDMTRFWNADPELAAAIPCVTSKFRAGVVEKDPVPCFLADLIFMSALVVILALILVRFVMALVFRWFIAPKIAASPSAEKLARNRMGNDGFVSEYQQELHPLNFAGARARGERALSRKWVSPVDDDDDPAQLHTILLVTAYSEGEEGLRGTFDTLACTDYSDKKKLILCVADGEVKGSGNTLTTPEIAASVMEQDTSFGDPEPVSYISIATGRKQHNMARLYMGHYVCGEHRVPMILVAKCGTEEEANDPKPGNRGKRDSQIVLMGFFSRVLLNERMTLLDWDLFRKIRHLMGVTPDAFELILMVDADTMVYPDSLKLLVNAAQNDQTIMGLCGETRIANKRTSFITAIQVFEYYVSHHLAKAFESAFGGVTCLPGCFCMYRIKGRKGPNHWVPILANRDIVEEYSSNQVDTLHQKNLLLLGEDRFLTTLMLRTFPRRKMMFVPQAVCKTEVPDTFKVLLSQRRRWINSTVHNLLELVLVKNLCGVFCCSMQFIIAVELIGTVSLPVAIWLTIWLVITSPLHIVQQRDNPKPGDFVPLALLFLVLFLPAILILFTTFKLVYVGWLFAYLAGLLVWNFVLPLYAYWHFDDFSWGETRRVQDGDVGNGHGGSGGQGDFDVSSVPLKRWEEWERMRRKMEAGHSSLSVTVPYSIYSSPANPQSMYVLNAHPHPNHATPVQSVYSNPELALYNNPRPPHPLPMSSLSQSGILLARSHPQLHHQYHQYQH